MVFSRLHRLVLKLLTTVIFSLGVICALAPDPRFSSSNGPFASRRPIDRGLDGPTIRSTLPSALQKNLPWTVVVGQQQFTAVTEEAKKILCETMGEHFATQNGMTSRDADPK